MDQQPLLSIIIPAYNEERRLPKSLDSIIAFVDEQCRQGAFATEVLVVENGSRDRTTEVAEAYAAKRPYIKVLHSSKGKGAAVRVGMMAGQGRYLFMCDSDLSMPIEEVLKFLPPKLDGYDVAIASREGPGAHRYNEPPLPPRHGARLQPDRARHRHPALPGHAVRLQELSPGGGARSVRGRHDGRLGLRRGGAVHRLHRGYKVVAVPINWYHDPDSRVSPGRDTLRMVRDVLKIRVNGWKGVYKRKKG